MRDATGRYAYKTRMPFAALLTDRRQHAGSVGAVMVKRTSGGLINDWT
jgi:hypothetical protein